MKSAGDRTLTMVAIRSAGLLFGLVALPFVDWPAPESGKWLALTSCVMFAHYALLIRSYGLGDMSVVYPLARGIAPVLLTVVAYLAIGAVLGTVVLKEGFGLRRLAASALGVGGIGLLALLR